MSTARIDNKWFRCPTCGHKLCRMVGDWKDKRLAMPALEIKCNSCKDIVYIMIGGKKEKHD